MGPKSLINAETAEVINAKGLISSPNTMITSQCDNVSLAQDTTTNKKERKRWNLNKENGKLKPPIAGI